MSSNNKILSLSQSLDHGSNVSAPVLLFLLLKRNKNYNLLNGYQQIIDNSVYIYFDFLGVLYSVSKVGEFVPGASLYFCSKALDSTTWINLDYNVTLQLYKDVGWHLISLKKIR